MVLQSTSPLFYGVRVLWGNKKKSVVLTVQQQYAEDREGRTCSMNDRRQTELLVFVTDLSCPTSCCPLKAGH